MQHVDPHAEPAGRFHLPWWVAACMFAVIAVFFLWEEHKAHILGALPYLIFLACPLIHLFMHRGHHGHGGGHHCDHEDHDQAGGAK